MQYLKDFASQSDGVGYTADAPFVAIVDDIDDKVLYIPEETGQAEIVSSGDFLSYKKKEKANYLTFTCTDSTSEGSGVFWEKDDSFPVTIYYSLNGSEWAEVPNTESDAVMFVNGDVIRFKGNNEYISYNRWNYNKFGIKDINNTQITVTGSIMSLLDGFGSAMTITHEYCFNYLLYRLTNITKVGNICPATGLSTGCYFQMLRDCQNLSDTSELRLPATTLSANCYENLFQYCFKLSEIHCAATDVSASNCTANWVTSVPSTGNFYCPSSTSWTTDSVSGIPTGWTRIDE